MKSVSVVGDRVLLKQVTDNEETSGGILVSQSKGERTEAWAMKYRVIGLGKKIKSLEVGNFVYVNKWDLVHMHIDGEQLAVSKVDDVVVKED